MSELSVLGPGTFYTYDKDGNKADSSHYSGNQIVKSYFTPEPRIAASYQLNDQTSVKLSYDRNVQNIHLLSNSAFTSTSVYLPSSNNN